MKHDQIINTHTDIELTFKTKKKMKKKMMWKEEKKIKFVQFVKWNLFLFDEKFKKNKEK